MICPYCIMDDTVPDIQFYPDGCTYCKQWQKRATKDFHSPLELTDLLYRAREDNKGKDFNCIIGLSGGMDSSFVALKCIDFGLKPYAIHLDNTWNTPEAEHNIEALVSYLNIPLERITVNWPEFRDLQLAFLRSGVPNCEIPTDHGLLATLFKRASDLGIKYILSGGNLVTEGIMPEAWSYETKDWKHIKAIWKKHGNYCADYSSSYPHLTLFSWFYHIFVRGVRFIPILNYVDYDPVSAENLLADLIGWEPYGTKHFESIYTRWFQGYLLPKRWGIDKRKAFYSSLICAGLMSRETALLKLSSQGRFYPQYPDDMSYVIKHLGIYHEEMEELVHQPGKQHSDYPSNARVLNAISGLVPRIKRFAST